MNKKDGGPAFPIVLNGEAMGEMQEGDGMTLRDYFAAKAMQGMLSREASIRYHEKDVAKVCYGFADAMLAEREK